MIYDWWVKWCRWREATQGSQRIMLMFSALVTLVLVVAVVLDGVLIMIPLGVILIGVLIYTALSQQLTTTPVWAEAIGWLAATFLLILAIASMIW